MVICEDFGLFLYQAKNEIIYWINIKGIDMTSPHKRGKCVSIKF